MSVEGDTNLAGKRAEWRQGNVGPRSELLLARDESVFLHQSLSTPCLDGLAAAKGSTIYDLDGRSYLDFHGNSVHQVGHGNPRVIQAVKDQLDSLPFCPRRFTNEPSVRLAEKLTQLSGLERALFVPGGSQAIGVALKLARLATGRFKTISMWDSFHGASLEASSVGGEDLFRKGFGPMLPGTEHVSPPDPIRCPLGCGSECSLACASYLEYVLEKEGDVAAVIAEPIRCTTVVKPHSDYWLRIRRACDRAGTLLIFDEIPTCLGRTGKMFAKDWTGVEPDILVIGKGLGGGVMPLAALLAREELNVAGQVSIGHYTHEKSPLAAAAALSVLEVIENEGLVERSQELGDSFAAKLRGSLNGIPAVKEIRNLGLLIGVELNDPALAEAVLYQCLAKGLSFKVSSGTVLTLTPPLTVSEAELELALEILIGSLNELSLLD